MLTLETFREDAEPLVYELRRDLGPHACYRLVDAAPATASVEIVLQRDPYVRVSSGKSNPGGAVDPDELMADLGEENRLTHHIGTASEVGLPEVVADDDHRHRRPHRGLVAMDVPAEVRAQTEEVYESACDPGHRNPLGCPAHVDDDIAGVPPFHADELQKLPRVVQISGSDIQPRESGASTS